MSDAIRKLPRGVLDSNYKLQKLKIGEKVTEIGGFAFGECENLTDLILPRQLKKYQKSAINGCSSLKKVVNESKIDVALTTEGIPGRWYCDGQEVGVLRPGKTAYLKPTTYRIHYNFDGGHAVKNHPKTYETGKKKLLPVKSLRKGKYISGTWEIDTINDKDDEEWDICDYISKDRKKDLILKPVWLDYNIQSEKKGCLTAKVGFVNGEERLDYRIDLRYSDDISMRNCKYIEMSNSKNDIISGLQSGKKYYIEYTIYDNDSNVDEDGDLAYEEYCDKFSWRGKKCVIIK